MFINNLFIAATRTLTASANHGNLVSTQVQHHMRDGVMYLTLPGHSHTRWKRALKNLERQGIDVSSLAWSVLHSHEVDQAPDLTNGVTIAIIPDNTFEDVDPNRRNSLVIRTHVGNNRNFGHVNSRMIVQICMLTQEVLIDMGLRWIVMGHTPVVHNHVPYVLVMGSTHAGKRCLFTIDDSWHGSLQDGCGFAFEVPSINAVLTA